MRIARMIQAVDAHACGEPGRVIVGGFLDVPGKTVFEKMQYIEKNATVLLETGMVPMSEPVTELTLESPAGLIRIKAECRGGKVRNVTFRNVPAFAVHIDLEIDVPHLGKVTVDVAYGGMFYVLSDATRFGLKLTPDEGGEIVRIGEMIKAAAQEQLPVVHPDQPGFKGITIAVMTLTFNRGASSQYDRKRVIFWGGWQVPEPKEDRLLSGRGWFEKIGA
ncbi:MAG: proline racemase family protein [Planctomycetes bacterium]|nr:proline racemase family protein [Planctomycetota bacterium]